MAALNTWAGCRGEAQSRKPLDFTLPGRQREAMAGVDHDLVLAGGGLAAGLVALAFRKLRPEVGIAIVEPGPTIGGSPLRYDRKSVGVGKGVARRVRTGGR